MAYGVCPEPFFLNGICVNCGADPVDHRNSLDRPAGADLYVVIGERHDGKRTGYGPITGQIEDYDLTMIEPGTAMATIPLVSVKTIAPEPPAANVILPGRHGAGQVGALFSKSGMIGQAPLMHFPILAFRQDAAGFVRVEIIRHPTDALRMPRDTWMMWQWQGVRRSDWFKFRAGDLVDYLTQLRDG